MPASSAAASTKVLNDDPGWRPTPWARRQAPFEAAAAHHRPDAAVTRVDGDQGDVGAARGRHLATASSAARCMSLSRVWIRRLPSNSRRVRPSPGPAEAFVLLELALEAVDELRARPALRGLILQRLLLRLGGLGGVDHPERHPLQHRVAQLLGPLRVVARVERLPPG